MLITDSIVGLSLNKAFKSAQSKKKNVIVAVIDTEMDINHTFLKSAIWKNKREIPNNDIDDDDNGYVDDINGWNFLGNSEGVNITEANKEYVRIYRFYNDMFKRIDTTRLTNSQAIAYGEYKKFKKKYFDTRKRLEVGFKRSDSYFQRYLKAKKALKAYFPDYKYSIEVLNKIDTVGNGLRKHVDIDRAFIEV